MCGDSQFMRAAVVLDLTARRNLEARICALFRSFITDWCGYELAVDLTAQASDQPRSFVRAVLEKRSAAASTLAFVHGLG